jgi:hypothetical protein
MREKIPLPNDPFTGIVTYEDAIDVTTGDEIEVREDPGENTETTDRYVIMSVRDDNSVYTYNYNSEEFKLFEKGEFESLLNNNTSYHWAILLRDIVPLANSNDKSVALYSWAFQNPVLGESERGLMFGWAITEQNPVESMPDLSGSSDAIRFDQLREKVVENSDGDLDGLFDVVESPENILDTFIKSSEFNCRKRFHVEDEPMTYDEQFESKAEMTSEKAEDIEMLANELYV